MPIRDNHKSLLCSQFSNIVFLVAVLYTFFGLRLLYIAWRADPNSTPQRELEEVHPLVTPATTSGQTSNHLGCHILTKLLVQPFRILRVAVCTLLDSISRFHGLCFSFVYLCGYITLIGGGNHMGYWSGGREARRRIRSKEVNCSSCLRTFLYPYFP